MKTVKFQCGKESFINAYIKDAVDMSVVADYGSPEVGVVVGDLLKNHRKQLGDGLTEMSSLNRVNFSPQREGAGLSPARPANINEVFMSYRVSVDVENHSIKIIDKSEYRDIELAYKPKVGETYYLIYCTYTTGNSFGRDPEIHSEIIDLYENKALADLVYIDLINNSIRRPKSKSDSFEDYEKSYSIELTNHAGSVYRFRPPWWGYFEELEEVVFLEVSLEPKRKSFRRYKGL